jgi:hypothetical protein
MPTTLNSAKLPSGSSRRCTIAPRSGIPVGRSEYVMLLLFEADYNRGIARNAREQSVPQASSGSASSHWTRRSFCNLRALARGYEPLLDPQVVSE